MTDELKKISRKDAKAQKLSKYFNGIPCKANHICERYVVNCLCVECMRIYGKPYRQKTKVHARERLKEWRRRQGGRRKKLPASLPTELIETRQIDFRWVSYEYCKATTNELNITTIAAYHAWVKHNRPGGIPSNPDHVYEDEWTGWADFLNAKILHLTDLRKVQGGLSSLVTYEEAVKLVHPLQFTTMKAYLAAFDAGELPIGLPKKPDTAYTTSFKKNEGWDGYLGKSINAKLRVSKESKSFLVLYNSPNSSNNILSIFIYRDGLENMKKTIISKKIPVVKIYNWYDDYSDEIFKILNAYGTKQSDVSWLFANIHEILFELATVLEVVNP